MSNLWVGHRIIRTNHTGELVKGGLALAFAEDQQLPPEPIFIGKLIKKSIEQFVGLFLMSEVKLWGAFSHELSALLGYLALGLAEDQQLPPEAVVPQYKKLIGYLYKLKGGCTVLE